MFLLNTVFFFFKQKTAYEMRISDWSSDVCSSDLDWGWRIPFLISVILLGVSLWIRLQLQESPVFRRMKEEGTTSKAPLTEAFCRWANLKWVLVALLGAVAGQAVVWYPGQFFALFFLDKIGSASSRERVCQHV